MVLVCLVSVIGSPFAASSVALIVPASVSYTHLDVYKRQMQYIKLKKQAEDVDLFSDDEVEEGIQPISHEDYERLIE